MNNNLVQQQENQPRNSFRWVTGQGLLVAGGAGLIALALVILKITIPIPGTDIVTDLREVLVTLGAALSGPVGSLLVGILAGFGEEQRDTVLASIVTHVVSGAVLAVIYLQLFKVLRKSTFRFAVLWILSIAVYYFGLLIPTYFLTYNLYHAEKIPFGPAYAEIARALTVEFIMTAVLTTALLVLLPRRYRRPLWGN
ncbi:MAG: hypothetical protein JW987_03190 [Anaerolineaceae bacterium]|nr:hypothetical protein [Anaerolineaceae bacterium]